MQWWWSWSWLLLYWTIYRSDSDSLGSEHTKSGTHFPLEVQLVHYKESLGSFEYALNDPEGLAILSVFFQVRIEKSILYFLLTDNDFVFQLHVETNAKWDHFLPLVKNVTKAGTEVILNAPFPLSYLLPSNTQDFYRYIIIMGHFFFKHEVNYSNL